jgi:hypothetical protein
MGASFNHRIFPATTDKKEITKEWGYLVSESLHQDGHSYSGGIGMLGHTIAKWIDLKLPDLNKAVEYIEEKQEKWDPAIAVSYKKGNDIYWCIGGWCSS